MLQLQCCKLFSEIYYQLVHARCKIEQYFILILFRQACVNFFVECLHVIIDINIKDVKSIFAFICSFTSFYLFCTKNVKC